MDSLQAYVVEHRLATGETVRFRMTVNEMILAQKEAGITELKLYVDALESMRSLEINRSFFKYALRFEKPEITDDEAGHIMTSMGGVQNMRLAIDKILRWFLPENEEKAQPGKARAASPGTRPS